MRPTWGLSAPDGPHVGPMNLAIRDSLYQPIQAGQCMYAAVKWVIIDSGNVLSPLWHQTSNYLNQWWLIDNCTLRNKFHRNLLQDLKISFKKMQEKCHLENAGHFVQHRVVNQCWVDMWQFSVLLYKLFWFNTWFQPGMLRVNEVF